MRRSAHARLAVVFVAGALLAAACAGSNGGSARGSLSLASREGGYPALAPFDDPVEFDGKAWIYEGEFLETTVVDTAVIRLSDGTYRMYYITADRVERGGPDGLSAENPRIMTLTSADGIEWSDPVPAVGILPGGTPEPIELEDGTIRVFIKYRDEPVSAWESTDGVTFERVFDREGVCKSKAGTGSVHRLDDGTWRMWVNEPPGCDDPDLSIEKATPQVYSARSDDGVRWRYEKGVRVWLIPEGPRNPDVVIREDGTYLMTYWIAHSTMATESKDGLEWSRGEVVGFGADPGLYIDAEGNLRVITNIPDLDAGLQRSFRYVYGDVRFELGVVGQPSASRSDLEGSYVLHLGPELTLKVVGEEGVKVDLSVFVLDFEDGVFSPGEGRPTGTLSPASGTVPFEATLRMSFPEKEDLGSLALAIVEATDGRTTLRLPLPVSAR